MASCQRPTTAPDRRSFVCFFAVLALLYFMASVAQGRPVGRTLSQANNESGAPPPLAAGADQPCPVVDCGEVDQTLACARDSRIPTTFVINGNTCNGCMTCRPDAASTKTTPEVPPKEPNGVS